MLTYIIKSNSIYKIGRTTNLEKRLKSLATGNPDIEVIIVYNEDIESSLHNLFKEYHYKLEWYKLPNDFEEIIKESKLSLVEKVNEENDYVEDIRSVTKEKVSLVICLIQLCGFKYKEIDNNFYNKPNSFKLFYNNELMFHHQDETELDNEFHKITLLDN